jgi:hypothetical protein
MGRPRSWVAPALLAIAACLVAAAAIWCTTGGGRPAPSAAPPPPSPDRDLSATTSPTPETPDLALAPPTGDAAGETEDQLMARLRRTVDPRPRLALELARQAERRFPDSAHGDERSLLKMRALVHLGQIAAARDEAMSFHQRFPRSPLAAEVQRLTGAHPRPRPGPRPGP